MEKIKIVESTINKQQNQSKRSSYCEIKNIHVQQRYKKNRMINTINLRKRDKKVLYRNTEVV